MNRKGSVTIGIKRNSMALIKTNYQWSKVAHAILEAKNEVLDFNQLLVEIQEYMELSDEALESRMARFYTDLISTEALSHLEITVGDYALGIQSILSMKKLRHLWKTKK